MHTFTHTQSHTQYIYTYTHVPLMPFWPFYYYLSPNPDSPIKGAGFTNVVFCQPGTSVIELPLTNAASAAYFGHIAVALDLDYWVVPQLNMTYTGHTKVSSVEAEVFRGILKTIEREHDNPRRRHEEL